MPSSTPVARSPWGLLAFLPVAALSAVLTAGCGGGGAAPKSADTTASDPVAASDAPLTDAESALAELGRAESEITSLLGPAPAEAVASAEPTAPPEPPPPVAQSPAAAPLGGEATASKAARPSAAPVPDACSVACRALASMARAATHLCGLSGEADPSCTNARERVRNATDRVSARCPCGK